MPAHRLKSIADLQEWLIKDNGHLENFVVLGRGEELTLGARLLTDPEGPEFRGTLENAHRIGAWTAYGTANGALTPEEAYDVRPGRGPVRFGPPNQKGLYGMAGGIWCWCADVYEKEAYSTLPQENPFNAPKDEKDRRCRVLRGGSWVSDDLDYFRAACRYKYGPDYRDYGLLGARLAASAQDSG